LTDYNSRSKRERSTKLGTHGERDPHYRWKVTPTSGMARLPRKRVRLFIVVDHWSFTLRDVIIAHVISADAHIYAAAARKRQSNLRTSRPRASRSAGW